MKTAQIRRADDGGSAVVEFIVVVVIIMVPISYAAAIVLKLHSASSAVIVAARESGRAYVTAESIASGGARAKVAARLALSDQGISDVDVRVRCLNGPCLSPGSRVRVDVTTAVPLPFVPFGGDRGVIPVTSSHDAVVDTYRESA